jgi:polysaccharide pyruvyl transferase WcaK-like protein
LTTSFFSPKTQFENLGDALINAELIKLIANNSKLIVDSSRSTSDFFDSLDVTDSKIETMNSGFISFLLKMIKYKLFDKEDCYYFLSPGGYVGELTYIQFIQQILNNVMLVFIKFCGVKLCLVGVSYERLGERYAKIMRFRAKYLYSHLVRDSVTQNYMNKLDIKITGISPDLAFNIFEKKVIKNQDSNIIVFSFRIDQDIKQFDLVKNFVLNIEREFLDKSTLYFYSQVERDVAGMERLLGELSSDLKLTNAKIISANNLAESINVFKDAKIVISNRLHVLLLAASQKCKIYPCYHEGFNQKLVGLFSDIMDGKSQLIDLKNPSINFTSSNFIEPLKIAELVELLKKSFKSIFKVQ